MHTPPPHSPKGNFQRVLGANTRRVGFVDGQHDAENWTNTEVLDHIFKGKRPDVATAKAMGAALNTARKNGEDFDQASVRAEGARWEGKPPSREDSIEFWSDPQVGRFQGDRFGLIGQASNANNPVCELLQRLGVDSNNLATAKDAVVRLIKSGAELNNPQVWAAFVREVTEAQVRALQGGPSKKPAEILKPLAGAEGDAFDTSGSRSPSPVLNMRSSSPDAFDVMKLRASGDSIKAGAPRELDLSDAVKAGKEIVGQISPLNPADKVKAEDAVRDCVRRTRHEQPLVKGAAFNLEVAKSAYEWAGIRETERRHEKLTALQESAKLLTPKMCEEMGINALIAEYGSKESSYAEQLDLVEQLLENRASITGTTPEAKLQSEITARAALTALACESVGKKSVLSADHFTAAERAAMPKFASTLSTRANPKAASQTEARALAEKKLAWLMQPNDPAYGVTKAAFEAIFAQGTEPKSVYDLAGATLCNAHADPSKSPEEQRAAVGAALAQHQQDWDDCHGDPKLHVALANGSLAALAKHYQNQTMQFAPATANPSPGASKEEVRRTLAQQRTEILQGVLSSSMSIEDKIFCFMLWTAAFADKDREQMLAEMADFDRQELEIDDRVAAGTKAKIDAGDRMKQIDDEIAVLKEKGSKPGADLAAIDGQNKVLQDVKARISFTLRALEAELKSFEEERISLGRSKELVSSELERVQRFRGVMIDISNTLLRDAARRISSILQ